MHEFHSEPYAYLAGLSYKSALIAWGAFYFTARSQGRMKLVDDDDLQWGHPPRRQTVGATGREATEGAVSAPSRRLGTDTESQPAASNDTPGGRSQNRRVVVKVR
jgi:hypothetical protein